MAHKVRMIIEESASVRPPSQLIEALAAAKKHQLFMAISSTEIAQLIEAHERVTTTGRLQT